MSETENYFVKLIIDTIIHPYRNRAQGAKMVHEYLIVRQ